MMPLSSLCSEVVSNRAYPIAREWKVSLTPNLPYAARSFQNRKDFGRWYTAHHCINSRISHHEARVDNEHRRFRDAASLSCIQHVPFANHVPFYVAQHGKGQREL